MSIRCAFRLVSYALLLVWTACSSSTAPSRGLAVHAIFPTSGSTFGGETVTLTGSRFASPMTVRIGGAPAREVVVTSDTTATFTTPPHASGAVDLSVAGSGDPVVLKSAFRYVTPTISNAPPSIGGIMVRGRRTNQPAGYGNVGEALDVTAMVTNDLAPGTLTYRWTQTRGAISGSGPEVVFTAPASAGNAVLTLTVTEDYPVPDANGLPVMRQHVVSAQTMVDVHDEVAEVSAMSRDFLLRFSDSSVAPLDVMHNFKEGCGAGGRGRADELEQVINNRRNFLHVDSSVGPARTTVSFNGFSPFRARRADAWSAVDVFWRSQCLRKDDTIGCATAGQVGDVRGVDWVTAIYDGSTRRWWLCDSDFEGRQSAFANYLR